MNNFILKLGVWLSGNETIFSKEISRQSIVEICLVAIALVYVFA
jgi:hypothetical protein